ncbi:hypothetical protein RhiirC2_782747 [Rhizophagus irregularis]|uniref:Uncharacterized protein n=1 Tax=Rhizophagus irregularis TaxID=588596 RepID=A0A2N1N2F0_9GLOM|nr:hypothetical protein RhiirC2_782747 [Rhizophagus irregularis]
MDETNLEYDSRKYDLHTDEYADCIKKAYNENIAQKYIKEYLAKRVTGYKEYNYYYSSNWAEMKKYHKAIESLLIMDILKCLANPKYHCISKVNNNIAVVKSSEYAQYMCKKASKQYPCDSLEIDYFKSCYISTINRDSTIIDFLDINNNVEYM